MLQWWKLVVLLKFFQVLDAKVFAVLTENAPENCIEIA